VYRKSIQRLYKEVSAPRKFKTDVRIKLGIEGAKKAVDNVA